ncbi:hypothetical protein OQA88_11026 [Cercophora sp. LCS_1]
MGRSDWEAHRAEIKRLYISEDKSVDDVMRILREKGFSRKTAQYERKLREWGLKKNISAKAGRVIAGKIRKRERAGKKSEVRWNGNRLSSSKVQGVVSRHEVGVSDVEEEPETPKGFVVCSPGPSGGDLRGHVFDDDALGRDKSPWALFLSSLYDLGIRGCFTPDVNLPPKQQTASIGNDKKLRAIIPEAYENDSLGGILVSLYLLSNNHVCGVGDLDLGIQDDQVVGLLEKIESFGEADLVKILSLANPTAQAIRDRCFASALRKHQLRLLQLIIKTGVDLNSFVPSLGEDKKTPLHPRSSPLCLAIARKRTPVVGVLTELGARITPEALVVALQMAPEHERFGGDEDQLSISMLLSLGTNLETRITTTTPFSADVTLLGWAVMQQNAQLITRLVGMGADVNAPQFTDCFTLLPLTTRADHMACRSRVSTTVLGLAVARNDPRSINYLALNAMFDEEIEIDGTSSPEHRCPLLVACARGMKDTAELLADIGADVPRADRNALAMGCCPMSLNELSGWDSEELQREKSPKESSPEESPLGEAAESTIHTSVDGNRPGPSPGPDLWDAAAKGGRVETMVGLIANGADINKRLKVDKVSRTALEIASETGNIEMLEMLLEHGAEVNTPAEYVRGATALQLAAIKGHIKIAEMLVDVGADVNAPGAEINGRTALEGAAEHGRIDMLHWLLQWGARTTGDGRKQVERAIQLARAEGHNAVANYLSPESLGRMGLEA